MASMPTARRQTALPMSIARGCALRKMSKHPKVIFWGLHDPDLCIRLPGLMLFREDQRHTGTLISKNRPNTRLITQHPYIFELNSSPSS